VTTAKLIIFCGPPCSGKSTLARRLHEETGFRYLELDEIHCRLIPESSHTGKERDITYRAMHLMTECFLQVGSTVILDATYARPETRDDLKTLTSATDVPVFVIQCRVDPATAMRRFSERRGSHQAKDLTLERVQSLAQEFRYDRLGLNLDTAESFEQCLGRIRSYLETNPSC
jgi:hypothetical protein